jgi:putative drug exporter of the RND superfamily
MALRLDFKVLMMTRIREEAHRGSLIEAVVRAIDATGGVVASAGLILAGSFAVHAVTGGEQLQQIGLGIAAGILLDTFLIRTLLIPSLVVIAGCWNCWPYGPEWVTSWAFPCLIAWECVEKGSRLS